MGVFSAEQPMNVGYTKGESLQKCKRDYEAEIDRLKRKLLTSGRLLSALEDYAEFDYIHGNAQMSYSSLVGGLYIEQKAIQKSIEAIQEEWEREK